MDDDANKYKKVVATHANYISSCKFMHSDQQVIISFASSTDRLIVLRDVVLAINS